MPFVPHTPADEQYMLEAIGASSIEDLFDEIPPALRAGVLTRTPDGISEMELLRLMSERARADEVALSFLGAGAYQHHIPAAVWELVGRGEFLTAYTPYQAEASQGTLQLIYEFQTMITRLTAMDCANASVYEGASALAEAILMAVRANRKSKSRKVLTLGSIHPRYLSACNTIVRNQGLDIEIVAVDDATGTVATESLGPWQDEDIAALIVPCPNFFGALEEVDALTNWAHAKDTLLIAVVNPVALALIRPPGEWGETGADIVVGEGQPLGVPLASGGPYVGFMCCTQALVRQMPGRIIGATEDLDGKPGYALTLQAREQHIRRAKATSNICTNQGLLVTAATIHMSLLGDQGLASIANQCHGGTMSLLAAATSVPGVSRRFSAPVFHEVALQLPKPAVEVLARMREDSILGGYDLGQISEALADCMLVNVTETKTSEDIAAFTASLKKACEE
ncbi:MAG: aminomethyl-transferring glycine dehydrogenase subunit GcvPA [Pseudomonadales bacterium]|nr:aminomethyl-transferring glycine dehydrogenase subunit GcvPA [Pseudomonadales bacterium]